MSRSLGFLSNFGVAHKILAVVGTMTIVTGSLVAMTSLRTTTIATDVDLYVQRVDVDQRALKLDAMFSKYRRHVREYALSGQNEELVAAETDHKSLKAHIAETLALTQKPERRKALTDLDANLRVYHEGFQRIIEERRVTKAAVVEVTPTIAAILEGPMKSAARKITEDAISISTSAHAEEAALAADLRTLIAEVQSESMILGIFGCLFGIAVGWLIGNGISGPLLTLRDAMRRLASGDLQATLPGLSRGDEIGEIARAVGDFKTKLIDKATEDARLEIERKAAADKDRREALLAMANEVERDVGTVVQAVAACAAEMQMAARSLTAAATKTSERSTSAAAASEQTSVNVRTVASATEELSASIEEIGQQVHRSSTITRSVEDSTGRISVEMSALGKAAESIGEIADTISAIATQTNLLALNATIEAARAGEAGRGFAVVASEVKALAAETSKATGEVSQRIGAVRLAVESAAALVDAITATTREASSVANSIAATVSQQNDATREIAMNVSEASKGTDEVAKSVVDVSRTAADSSKTAANVLSLADGLARQSTTLSQKVDSFVRQVRAG